MKSFWILLSSLLVFCLASCAGTTDYPITLMYQPVKPQYEKTGSASITVATLSDKRTASNKRLLGTTENGTEFLAMVDKPAESLSKGFAVYLVSKGYAVNTTDTVWDGEVKTITPNKGDILIGGTLDDLSINVTGNMLKTEYDCSVKFTVSIVDAGTKELLHREKFAVTTSYVTLLFSREKAEELINKAMSEAVEKAMSGMDTYLRGHGKA